MYIWEYGACLQWTPILILNKLLYSVDRVRRFHSLQAKIVGCKAFAAFIIMSTLNTVHFHKIRPNQLIMYKHSAHDAPIFRVFLLLSWCNVRYPPVGLSLYRNKVGLYLASYIVSLCLKASPSVIALVDPVYSCQLSLFCSDVQNTPKKYFENTK